MAQTQVKVSCVKNYGYWIGVDHATGNPMCNAADWAVSRITGADEASAKDGA